MEQRNLLDRLEATERRKIESDLRREALFFTSKMQLDQMARRERQHEVETKLMELEVQRAKLEEQETAKKKAHADKALKDLDEYFDNLREKNDERYDKLFRPKQKHQLDPKEEERVKESIKKFIEVKEAKKEELNDPEAKVKSKWTSYGLGSPTVDNRSRALSAGKADAKLKIMPAADRKNPLNLAKSMEASKRSKSPTKAVKLVVHPTKSTGNTSRLQEAKPKTAVGDSRDRKHAPELKQSVMESAPNISQVYLAKIPLFERMDKRIPSAKEDYIQERTQEIKERMKRIDLEELRIRAQRIQSASRQKSAVKTKL